MMKSTLKSIVLLLLLFVTTASFAAGSPKFTIQKTSTTAFVLKLQNVKETAVSVKLSDLNQYVLMEESLQVSKAARRQYNLKNLPPGAYNLIVDFGSVIKVQRLYIVRTELEVTKSDVITIHKPVFDFKQDQLNVNMLCLDLDRVKLEFTDQDGNVNFTEIVKVEGTFGKRFDLSQLDPGNYKLSLAVNERGFSRSFSKDITIK